MVLEFQSDLVVVGSGIAGLCFALETAAKHQVTILTKKEDFESNTNYAQGGIACVSSATDSFEDHVRDTLIAGAGLCHEEVVRGVVREGPELVRKLIEWGVHFTGISAEEGDGTSSGEPIDLARFDLGREGGHSHRRILHASDLTGREVERALLKALREHPNVTFLEHHIAIELRTGWRGKERVLAGVIAYDVNGNQLKVFNTSTVVLATGGIGRIYLHTTNPPIATGDGISIAWRAGLPVANLEFVQFHPTSFYNPRGETFLISEAVRGEGAILRRKNKKTFMEKYDERGCLAPRDIVARAIDTEMKLHGETHVLLDCSNMTEEFFSKRFPSIQELCRKVGIHPPKDPIPVVPAAHYSCGGVMTDMEGKTRLPGLYVTGEAAFTGIHGGNRLASNSLLEALVFSHHAAISVLNNPILPVEKLDPLPDWIPTKPKQDGLEGVLVEHTRADLCNLMWDYVGIVRKTERLQLAAEHIALLKREVEGFFLDGHITAPVIELRHMVQTAELVVRSALCRRESRGLHYTLDYPEPRDSEKHDTILDPTATSWAI